MQSNKLKISEYVHKSALKSRYGLAYEDYLDKLKQQDNKCALCFKGENGYKGKYRLAVDHCHKTGQIRGLLCNTCNNALGHFNDDIDTLKRAIEYLSKYNAQSPSE